MDKSWSSNRLWFSAMDQSELYSWTNENLLDNTHRDIWMDLRKGISTATAAFSLINTIQSNQTLLISSLVGCQLFDRGVNSLLHCGGVCVLVLRGEGVERQTGEETRTLVTCRIHK